MKKQYDFSHGVKGVFYKKGAEPHTAIYLDSELESYVASFAKQKTQTVNEVVSSILNADI